MQWEIWFDLYKKELHELLNYTFNSAKDFQHKLRKSSGLDISIQNKFGTLIDMK